MSKEMESQEPEIPQEEMDAVTLIRKVVQQLAYLEKKIDILLTQTKGRPSFQEKSYSKPPFRSYGNSQGYQGNRDNRSRGGDRGFEKRPSYDKHQGREDRSYGQSSSYDQGRDREGRPFDPKKKPFYNKNKSRAR